MKYVRTKDGIVDITDTNLTRFCECKIENNTLRTHYYCESFWSEEEIIAQADTIEELCDEFVLFYDNEETKPDLTYRGGFNDLYFQNELKHSTKCYGAIWTDKGLIYVAKMNSEGGLELL